jgi:hypothetical protein
MSTMTFIVGEQPFVFREATSTASGTTPNSNPNSAYWGSPMPLIAEDEATPHQIFGDTRLGEFISTIQRW